MRLKLKKTHTKPLHERNFRNLIIINYESSLHVNFSAHLKNSLPDQ